MKTVCFFCKGDDDVIEIESLYSRQLYRTLSSFLPTSQSHFNFSSIVFIRMTRNKSNAVKANTSLNRPEATQN